MRRTRARIAQLHTHLTRCRWRDGQAAEAYRTLTLARKGVKPSISCVLMDALFKSHYTLETLQPGRHAIFSMLGEDKFRGSSYGLASGVALGLGAYLPKENPMSRIVDEDVVPPIKTGVPSQAYKEGWERCFGQKPPHWTCADCGVTGTARYHSCRENYVIDFGALGFTDG